MKRWQKYWLYFLILFFLIHLVRDLLQDMGVKNLLSTTLVKPGPYKLPLYWVIVNTYAIETIMIIFSVLCLKRNKFGKMGYLAIFLTLFFAVAWLIYWFIL